MKQATHSTPEDQQQRTTCHPDTAKHM